MTDNTAWLIIAGLVTVGLLLAMKLWDEAYHDGR
jgi:hypothetical protein